MQRMAAGLVLAATLASGAGPAWAADVPFSLSSATSAYSKATVNVGKSSVKVVTAPEANAYAVTWKPVVATGYSRCEYNISYRAEGRVQFGVLTADQRSWLSTVVVESTPRKKTREVTLKVDAQAGMGPLVLANAQKADGVASTVEVTDVSVSCKK